jgi:fused signal recognition particle receptor
LVVAALLLAGLFGTLIVIRRRRRQRWLARSGEDLALPAGTPTPTGLPAPGPEQPSATTAAAAPAAQPPTLPAGPAAALAAVEPSALASPLVLPVAKPPPPVWAPPPSSDLCAGLAKTREGGFIARLGRLFGGKREIDQSLLDQLEEVLLTADIGVRTSQRLFDAVRGSLGRNELTDPEAVWRFIKLQSVKLLALDAPPIDVGRARPFVILVIGVNGVGKTTTIGKLGAQLAAQGKRVLLAAGDTFRAAATEQLEIWGQRIGAEVVRGKEGGDPSAVLFEAVRRAQRDGHDVVVADTAGRLHTKVDLMQELMKVRRVLGKAQDGAPHETLLVLDATNGQNAIAQAQMFKQAMDITGIVLAKLDGTAKGGVILGICDELRVPVRYIGIGERVQDLRPFSAVEFVEALYDRGAAPSVMN